MAILLQHSCWWMISNETSQSWKLNFTNVFTLIHTFICIFILSKQIVKAINIVDSADIQTSVRLNIVNISWFKFIEIFHYIYDWDCRHLRLAMVLSGSDEPTNTVMLTGAQLSTFSPSSNCLFSNQIPKNFTKDITWAGETGFHNENQKDWKHVLIQDFFSISWQINVKHQVLLFKFIPLSLGLCLNGYINCQRFKITTFNKMRRTDLSPLKRLEWLSVGGSVVYFLNKYTIESIWLWTSAEKKASINLCRFPQFYLKNSLSINELIDIFHFFPILCQLTTWKITEEDPDWFKLLADLHTDKSQVSFVDFYFSYDTEEWLIMAKIQ